MSISVLLGLTVYLFLLAKRTPETSLAIPLISRFLMFAMVAVTCSIVSSVIVLNIHHKHTVSDRIPKWATYFIFHLLPQWIFIQGPVKIKFDEEVDRKCLQDNAVTVTTLQRQNTRRRSHNKKSSLLASLAGSAGKTWLHFFD